MERLKLLDVSSVENPRFAAIQKCAKDDSLINLDLCWRFDATLYRMDGQNCQLAFLILLRFLCVRERHLNECYPSKWSEELRSALRCSGLCSLQPVSMCVVWRTLVHYLSFCKVDDEAKGHCWYLLLFLFGMSEQGVDVGVQQFLNEFLDNLGGGLQTS